MKNELEYIEKLVKLVNDNELTELSIEEGEKAIIIKKEKTFAAIQAAPVVPTVVTPANISASSPIQEISTAEILPATKKLQITSPMVGTYYGASSPGSEPFTSIGKTVKVGQVICIIEAMKLMNEIESEVSGTVVEILVQDGQPVEYGQVLIIVEPS